MLPELLISKLRILYLHSRRRYLINSISLLSIVALLVGIGLSLFPDRLHSMNSVYAIEENTIDTFASLTIDTSNIQVAVAPGQVGYAAKDITIQAEGSLDYALTIVAPASIQSDSGNTTLTAAGDNLTITNMPDNSWGYAYNQTGSVEDMLYSSFTGTSQVLESGNVTPDNQPRTLAFAAKFGNDASSGHYSAQIHLALTATPNDITTYQLSYDANGGTNAPSPDSVESRLSSHTFTVAAQGNLSRTGYKFLGWANSADATESVYEAGVSTITLQADTPTKTLYAVWKDIRTIGQITTMQQMNPEICNNTSTGTTYNLNDTRNNTTYTVQKFNDGRCWMTQNLKITNLTIYPSNSNISVEEARFYIPASSDSGFGSSTGSYAYVSGSTGYYSWCAATAGSCTNLSAGMEAKSSICPKGWELPSGGSNGEYSIFLKAENITSASQITRSPYSFTASGRIVSSNASLTGEGSGRYWTRTASGDETAYELYFKNGGGFNPGTGSSGRSNGFAVRCIAAQ